MPEHGTQCERVLAWLEEKGSIQPLEALRQLGVYRLGARIWDLKKAGHEIEEKRVEVDNQFGEPCRVSKYTLAKKPKPVEPAAESAGQGFLYPPGVVS